MTTETPVPPKPADLHLFYEPPGTLRLTVGEDHSFPIVRLYQAAPLSRPGRYLSLQDSKGEEIVLLDTLDVLSSPTRAIAEEEIARRYLTARILKIRTVRTEFGVTYWNVETDRGERDFVIQSLSESCIYLSERHLLLIDVDGSRFEIADRSTLDEASKEQLEAVL